MTEKTVPIAAVTVTANARPLSDLKVRHISPQTDSRASASQRKRPFQPILWLRTRNGVKSNVRRDGLRVLVAVQGQVVKLRGFG